MAPYMRSHSRRWSDLRPEILDLILLRLCFPDCFRFGGVCSSWRSALLASKHCCPARPPPLMVLLLGKHNRFSGHLMGLNGSQPLPLSSPKPTFHRYDVMVGSSFGWLVIASHRKSGLRLLSAISGQQILLPSTTSDGTRICLNRLCGAGFPVISVALSSPPTSDNCILVAHGDFDVEYSLAYLRLGRDQEWTTFTDHRIRGRNRMTFHNRKLIFTANAPVDTGILIFHFDPHLNLRAFCTRPNTIPWFSYGMWYTTRLVSSGEELFLVLLHNNPKIFKVGPGGCEVVESLGDRVLLLGYHASDSFSTQGLMGSGFEPNCIYYQTCDHLTKFSMVDRSQEMITIPFCAHWNRNYRGFEWVVMQV